MRVVVIGLGHLGSVTTACLAKTGHEVLGVDRVRAKVASINSGRAPIGEPGLALLLRSGWRKGHISAINGILPEVLASDLILVCVDTPRSSKRSLVLSSVVQVCESLREISHRSRTVPLVVIRSTLPPGAFDTVLESFVKERGRLRMAYNPDFSREGSAVADFMSPTRIVIGVHDRRDASKVRQLYKSFTAPVFITSWNNAEILKVADNAFHALKVTFANEIADISESFGADGEQVMSMLCADHRLNISPAYLRPGLPFGGPCLAKDLGALAGSARRVDISAPLLEATLESNRKHFERIVRKIESNHYRVGFLGLNHKAGVGDYRGSPLVALARRLRAAGVKVSAFDPRVGSRAHGSARVLSKREISRRSNIVFAPLRDKEPGK